VLAIDGEDLRTLPLLERKRRLRAIVPRQHSRLLLHVDAIAERGTELFRRALAAAARAECRWAHCSPLSERERIKSQ
jgi:ATP-dependent DNA ligase